jgi:hypothetical protein
MARVVACLAAGLWGCDRSPAPSGAPPSPSTSSTAADAASADWRTFEGSWNAAGSRRTIGLGAERSGSIIDLRGTMLLTGADRPGVGFRAEVIALSDTETGLAGRAVWTDEHGDRVFSELKGEGTRENNHITGTILGGTGRYGGVTGGYEFSWQFVIESEDGSIQGRAVGLKGRFRAGQPAAGASR